ncbi:thiamine pyrophosphate-dependent enzyme, partial [Elusimicrobiota bacterium]
MSVKNQETEFLPNKQFNLPQDEWFVSSGHLACAGCGLMPILKLAQQILGRNMVITAPACCFSVIDGPYPFSAAGVNVIHCAFETAAATASGVKAGLDVLGTKAHVMALAGDGGTFDIGFQALSAAAERNENVMYLCYDNEAYMNTGIQRSSSTPHGAWTTTTPHAPGKLQWKKDLGAIMAAHKIPYFATATVAYPDDLAEKIRKARDTKGFRMIHAFAPCPTGWKAESRYMVKLSRLAVETKVFPLYEVINGEQWSISMEPPIQPLQTYLGLQGRFKHLTKETIDAIQADIDHRWQALQK